MSEHPPDVAVIVPVRNGTGEIGRCVRSLLAQTLPPSEVVVVDNGSTDDGAGGREAQAAGARVITLPAVGVYAARNAGWESTHAPLVAFTDADCEADPDWLEQLAAGFEAADVNAVGGEIEVATPQRSVRDWARERGLFSQATAFAHDYRPYFAAGNVAYRRSALEQVGGFEPRLESGGDVDLAWRIQVATGGRMVFEPRARVRHTGRLNVQDLIRQQRRYGRGHACLDARWGHDAAYVATVGRPTERLRAVWLLPARLAWRLTRRRPLAVPVLDAATRLAREVGRWEGRRGPASSFTPVLQSPGEPR